MRHDEMEALLGAYALDAVEAEEAEEIEAHLPGCPRCRAELAAHREVAAALGNAGGRAPEGLWERIAGGLEGDAGPTAPPPIARIFPPTRSRRPVLVGVAAVAAALLIVVGFLAARVGELDSRLGTVASAVGSNAIAGQAAAAALAPGAQVVRLTSTTTTDRRRLAGELVVLPSGQAFWRGTGLRALPSDRTYQLWTLGNGGARPVSVALLGDNAGWIPVRLEAGQEQLLVTEEPLGGSPRPTSRVLAAGRLTAV